MGRVKPLKTYELAKHKDSPLPDNVLLFTAMSFRLDLDKITSLI